MFQDGIYVGLHTENRVGKGQTVTVRGGGGGNGVIVSLWHITS